MVHKIALSFALSSALIFSGQASAQDRRLQQLLEMSPSEFAGCTSVHDDALEVASSFSTKECFEVPRSWLTGTGADVWLRGFAHKETGTRLFQIVYLVQYRAEGWSFVDRMNALFPTGVQSFEISVLARDVDCTGSGCSYLEEVGAIVPEAEIAALAAQFDTAPATPLRLRFKSQAGVDFDTSVYPAEAAGLLLAMEQTLGAAQSDH